MFRIDKKVEESPRPRPLLIKFESLETKNMVLDNSNRLKDSESFNKIFHMVPCRVEDNSDSLVLGGLLYYVLNVLKQFKFP